MCVYGGVCVSFGRDVGNLTQPDYYEIHRDHVLRPFAPLVSIWPSESGKISGFYLLISNLELLPKACQVFILMEHLTFLCSMFFRSRQIEKHLKNIFFLNNKNILIMSAVESSALYLVLHQGSERPNSGFLE